MKVETIQINWHDMKPVLTIDFHSLSHLLATAGADFDIKLWAVKFEEDGQKKGATATYQNSLTYHGSAVNVIRFAPHGELLASGADGGELILWKLHSTEAAQTWKVQKSLSFHRKDVLDLQWSSDGAFLVTGSVDNSCIIWDVNKGSVLQILDAHLHYVQGVAWDPLAKYIASLSSDRICRIYVNKPQKSKGNEKLNFVCQHVISKLEPQSQDESKSVKSHLFHDETLPSFFRRLAWSPDGSFLLVPAGTHRFSPASEPTNTCYIISRNDLTRPALMLPGASKAVIAVRFCPVAFALRDSNSGPSFDLPYRLVFAMATLNSLYIYDTESIEPIAIMAGLHYAAITDIAWSPTGNYLAVSSQDGYCTLVEFENGELGMPVPLTEKFRPKEKRESTVQPKDMAVETSAENVHVSVGILKEKRESTVDEPEDMAVETSEDNVNGKVGIVKSEVAAKDEKETSVVIPVTKPAKRRITPMAIG